MYNFYGSRIFSEEVNQEERIRGSNIGREREEGRGPASVI